MCMCACFPSSVVHGLLVFVIGLYFRSVQIGDKKWYKKLDLIGSPLSITARLKTGIKFLSSSAVERVAVNH